jgi:hypothetical protein
MCYPAEDRRHQDDQGTEAPVLLLAGADDDTDNEPNICRGID